MRVLITLGHAQDCLLPLILEFQVKVVSVRSCNTYIGM